MDRKITLSEGKSYDCHFKAWNYGVNQLESIVKSYGVNYYIFGEKFIFENVSYQSVIVLEALSVSNGSIFFIDKEHG